MADPLPRCRLASWGEVDAWAETLSGKIRRRHRTYDTLVGLTRGGWVPARLLSDRLGVKRIVSLRAQHWGVTATPSGSAEITEELSGPVANERVLVVDDITDTGESLRLATDHVRAQGPAQLDSAAFLHIGHSGFRPDFYAERIPKRSWVWVIFPWNYWEDLRTLAARAAESDPRLAKVVERLREGTGVRFPRADVARALAEFSR